MYDYMRNIGNYVSSFWIIVIFTGEIFVVKLLMALFINTFLKHFNSQDKTEHDIEEEEDLNKLVRNEFIKKRAIHRINHTQIHHETFWLKEICLQLEHSDHFENFIMVIIITNIIVMAMDSPLLDYKSKTKVTIHYLEMCFTSIYGFEIAIKMIACGLFKRGGYFRDPKNLIDFLLFVLNIAGFFVSSSLGTLNALRAFHIIVLSKHFESLRIILISLTKSLPYLFKLFFFSFCFMLVFGK